MPDASLTQRPSTLALGLGSPLAVQTPSLKLRIPAHHLATHGVVVGMTGSGKAGLVTVLAEEALRAQVDDRATLEGALLSPRPLRTNSDGFLLELDYTARVALTDAP